MRRDELITKLARELPHWPAGLNKEQLDRLIAPILMPEHANDYHGCVDNWGKAEAYLYNWNITRADYLAECDRLGVTAPEPMPGPVKSTWDGEGLPPIGTVCEAKVSPGKWLEGEVLAHYSPGADGVELVVFAYQPAPECMRQVGQRAAHCFRPLRREEDQAIDEMVEAIVAHYEYPKGAEAYLGLARTLYRAGYRKTGGDV